MRVIAPRDPFFGYTNLCGAFSPARKQAKVIHQLPTCCPLYVIGEQVVKKKFFIFRAKYRIFFLVP